MTDGTGPGTLLRRWVDGSVLSRPLGRPVDYVHVGAIVSFFLYYVYRGLGETGLVGDEAIHASIAKYAATEGYWLLPHTPFHQGTRRAMGLGPLPFLKKPPLVFWLQGLSMKVFGVDEFAVRFQSATFGLLTAVVVYLVAREITDSHGGVLAALVFVTTGQLFTDDGILHGSTDMAFTFFGSLMVWFVWRAIREDDPRWLVYASVPAVGTVLAKGPAAGLWVVVLVPVVLVSPWVVFSEKSVTAIGIFLSPIVAWSAYVAYRTAGAERYGIYHNMIELNVVGRYQSSPDPEGPFGLWFDPFFLAILEEFDPWVYFLVPATGYLLWYGYTRDRDWLLTATFLAWWWVFIFAFWMRVGHTRHYMLPVYVPAALVVGWFFREVARGRDYSWVGIVVGVLLAVFLSPRTRGITPFTLSREFPWLFSPVPGWRYVAVVAVFAGILVFWPTLVRGAGRVLAGRRYRYAQAIVPVVCVILLVAALFGAASPNDERFASKIDDPDETVLERVAGVVESEVPENEPLVVFPAAAAAHSRNLELLSFYADNPIRGINPHLEHLAIRGQRDLGLEKRVDDRDGFASVYTAGDHPYPDRSEISADRNGTLYVLVPNENLDLLDSVDYVSIHTYVTSRDREVSLLRVDLERSAASSESLAPGRVLDRPPV